MRTTYPGSEGSQREVVRWSLWVLTATTTAGAATLSAIHGRPTEACDALMVGPRPAPHSTLQQRALGFDAKARQCSRRRPKYTVDCKGVRAAWRGRPAHVRRGLFA